MRARANVRVLGAQPGEIVMVDPDAHQDLIARGYLTVLDDEDPAATRSLHDTQLESLVVDDDEYEQEGDDE